MNSPAQIKSEFKSAEFERELGLRVNTLHYYVGAGAIIPDVDPGSGTGTRRIFSPTNYFEAAILSRLLNLGIPKRGIVAMLKSIRDAGDRKRLDPRRFFNKPSDAPREFLIFFRKGKGYSHRFVSNAEDQFARKTKGWKPLGDARLVSEEESLQDVLFTQPVGIVLDLDVIFASFWFARLLAEA